MNEAAGVKVFQTRAAIKHHLQALLVVQLVSPQKLEKTPILCKFQDNKHGIADLNDES